MGPDLQSGAAQPTACLIHELKLRGSSFCGGRNHHRHDALKESQGATTRASPSWLMSQVVLHFPTRLPESPLKLRDRIRGLSTPCLASNPLGEVESYPSCHYASSQQNRTISFVPGQFLTTRPPYYALGTGNFNPNHLNNFLDRCVRTILVLNILLCPSPHLRRSLFLEMLKACNDTILNLSERSPPNFILESPVHRSPLYASTFAPSGSASISPPLLSRTCCTTSHALPSLASISRTACSNTAVTRF